MGGSSLITGEPIPLVCLDNAAAWEALAPRLRELVLGGRFILGSELAEFESAAAEAFGCAWAVGTSSGTSALMLALKASALPPGSRVALPANTFFATFESVVHAGHRPVVIDQCHDHLIDLDILAATDIDAVVPVHLYGLPVDMPALMDMARARGWWVLEDCSQAHGAMIAGRPVGSFGDAAAFSAYPTKNLGAWGDAGFVTGSDPGLRDRIAALRHHGQTVGNVHDQIGGTARLDNLQALVLSEKLRGLGPEVAARRRVAAWYAAGLRHADLPLPGDRGDRAHAHHLYVVRVSQRDAVRARLAEAGVGTGIHYPIPVHRQPAAAPWVAEAKAPVAEAAAAEILSLPMFPGLREEQVRRVCEAVVSALP